MVSNSEGYLLAEGVFKTQQADGSIHENQVLNFLVNTIDEEVNLDFGPNAETTSEDVHEVLVGACADGTSVSTLCEKSEDSPHHNTVLYHLHKKFDLEPQSTRRPPRGPRTTSTRSST